MEWEIEECWEKGCNNYSKGGLRIPTSGIRTSGGGMQQRHNLLETTTLRLRVCNAMDITM